MTMTDTEWGLPDPDTHAEFYADVTSKRLIAFVIDTILIIILTILIIPFTAFIGLFFIGFLGLLVNLTYRTLTLAAKSATPGMRVMAIEFRNKDGERLGLGTAFVHSALFAISMSMVAPQLVSILLMLTSRRGQGLSDFLLGTAAINKVSTY